MSGLSIPVGFKNNTAGKIETAVNACSKASKPNCYCDFCENGLERVQTLGNPNSHVILRGGNGPNYDSESIGKAVDLSKVEGLEPAVIVDCSHGNSGKDPEKQPIVFESVVDQRVNNVSLKGVMVEVNKKGGKQSFEYGISCAASLDPYLSITDAGLSLEGYSQMLSKCLRG